jgi:hypothetical protein
MASKQRRRRCRCRRHCLVLIAYAVCGRRPEGSTGCPITTARAFVSVLRCAQRVMSGHVVSVR